METRVILIHQKIVNISLHLWYAVNLTEKNINK